MKQKKSLYRQMSIDISNNASIQSVSDWYRDIYNDYENLNVGNIIHEFTSYCKKNKYVQAKENLQLHAGAVLFLESVLHIHQHFSILNIERMCLGAYTVPSIVESVHKYIDYKYDILNEPADGQIIKCIVDNDDTRILLVTHADLGLVIHKTFSGVMVSNRSRYKDLLIVSKSALMEIRTATMVDDDNFLLVPINRIHRQGANITIIYRYCPFSVIDIYIKQPSRNIIVNHMLQLCCAVKYLHHNGIAHRDIKVDNIRINSMNDMVLIDYDSSKHIQSAEDANISCTLPMYTICNRPPEIINNNHYDIYKSDIWALGCVFAALCNNGRYVFTGNTEISMKKAIDDAMEGSEVLTQSYVLNKLCNVLPGDGVKLLQHMMHMNPTMRPTIEDVHTSILAFIIK